MKFNKLLILLSAILISAFVFTACSDDDDGDNGSQEFELTQAKLNASDNPIDLNITGDPFEGSVGHDGESHHDSTFRDVYSNLTSLGTTFNVGDIITKKVYAKNPDGSKGDLKQAFVMVKMDDEYDPDKANWAYINIPYNADNDYDVNPFGMLPSDWNPDDAKLANCISCHTKAGGSDFVFVNGN